MPAAGSKKALQAIARTLPYRGGLPPTPVALKSPLLMTAVGNASSAGNAAGASNSDGADYLGLIADAAWMSANSGAGNGVVAPDVILGRWAAQICDSIASSRVTIGGVLQLLTAGQIVTGSGAALADIAAGKKAFPGPVVAVYVYRPREDWQTPDYQLSVVAEADGAMLVNKPHGLATMPRGEFVSRSAVVLARRQFAMPQIVSAHRLDRLTGGLLLLVTDEQERGRWQLAFSRRRARKIYRALSLIPAGRTVNFVHSAHFLTGDVGQSCLPPVGEPYLIISYMWRDKSGSTSFGAREKTGQGKNIAPDTGNARESARNIGKSVGNIGGIGSDVNFETGFNFDNKLATKSSFVLMMPAPPSRSHGEALSLVRAQLENENLLPPPSLLETKQAQLAVTRATVISAAPNLEGRLLVNWQLEPLTGRAHQLRVHIAELGAPIYGDPIYPHLLPAQHPWWLSGPADIYPCDLSTFSLNLQNAGICGEHLQLRATGLEVTGPHGENWLKFAAG